MENSIVIGIDLGTTNIKAAAYQVNGKLVAELSESYPTYYPNLRMAEQSPRDWQTAVRHTLQRLVSKLRDRAHDIAALGLSAHAPSLVLVGVNGEPLFDRVPIWQDERSYEQGEKLLQAIGPDWIGLGMPFSAFAAKLKWFTETHPEKVIDASYAIGAKSYLAHYLTGRYATDPSSEPGNEKMWEEMCIACDWSLEQLPPVLQGYEVVGRMRPEITETIGLKRDIQVVIGLNDGASATLGNGLVTCGEGVITLGTNGVVFLVTDVPVLPEIRLEKAIFCWPYVEDLWIIGGQTKTGASSLQWLLGTLQEKKTIVDDFENILQACSATPAGSNGVLFFPYLMGRGTPDDDSSLSGGLVGLRMQSNRADMVHAVLEGVAFTLREVTDAFECIEQNIIELSVTGGGAKSELWSQILSDVLNRPLKHRASDSCLGAAVMAAYGIGLFPTLHTALDAMLPKQRTIQPRTEIAKIYEQLYEEYCKKRDAFLGFF